MLCTIKAEATETLGIEIMHTFDVGQASKTPIDPQLLRHYSKLVGQPLIWQERTRTHAQRVLLPLGSSRQAVLNAAAKLRKANGVLWVGTFSTNRLKLIGADQETLVRELIIKLNPSSPGLCANAIVTEKLSVTAGIPLKPLRTLTLGACVFRLAKALTVEMAQGVKQHLESLPEIQYVDLARGIHQLNVETPNDPYFPVMWFLKAPSDFQGASDVQGAWSVTTGRPEVTVAVIDSGILFNPTHPDLVSSLTYLTRNRSQIAGWDMISNSWQARDGNARDRNPRDEGTWVTLGESHVYPECVSTPPQSSSWHGSHVGGSIAAATNNRIGMTGVSWQVRFVPVRVIGACEGALYDLTDGIYWAASSIDVPETEPNLYPAHVINISLGGDGECPNSLQEAIDFALAQNVTVVIAAGNETTDVVDRGMANCKGALIVAASDVNGDLTQYSNYGTDIALAAPGGDPSYGKYFEIISTTNGSSTRPIASRMNYSYASGTSMAAPVVSGVVSLMISAALDRGYPLSTEAIRTILMETAKPYPPGTRCGSGGELEGLCGAGIIDAAGAVGLASTYSAAHPMH